MKSMQMDNHSKEEDSLREMSSDSYLVGLMNLKKHKLKKVFYFKIKLINN